VDLRGHQLLPRPPLAPDEHRPRYRRQRRDLVPQFHHRLRGAHQLIPVADEVVIVPGGARKTVAFQLQPAVLLHEAEELVHAFHPGLEVLGEVEVLFEEVDGAELHRSHGVARGAFAGEDHDRDIGTGVLHLLEHGETLVAPGAQVQVQDDEAEGVGPTGELTQSLFAAARGEDLVVPRCEHLLQMVKHLDLVVDQQDLPAHVISRDSVATGTYSVL
jgi:hypothetical protein